MKFFFLIPLLIFFLLVLLNTTSVFAEHILYEMWVWQKGITTFAEAGDSETAMTLTLPNGKINSQSILLNYIDAFTDQYDGSKLRFGGGFIQVGIVYPNSQKSGWVYDDMSFFYSDGVTPFPIEHPYNVGAKYTFQIYLDKDWWIYVTDDISQKKTFIKADWASGKLTSAGMVLENLGSTQDYIPNNKPNTLTQTKDVGTLSNIKDQQFFIGSKAGLRIPLNTIQGWDEEVEKMTVDIHALNHHIPPPKIALLDNNNEVYEVGFSNGGYVSEIPTKSQQSKIPEWIKNVFKFYVENKISEDELIQALQFLIKQGIIKV